MAGKSPWGGKGRGGGGNGGAGNGGDDAGNPGGGDSSGGPRNPWLPPGSGEEPRRSANIEDIFRSRGPKGPRRSGGGNGPGFRMPSRPGGKSWFPVLFGGLVLVGLILTSVHQIGPKQQAVVKTLGDYSHTLSPGLNFTLPFPIQTVAVEDVQGVRQDRIPEGSQEQKLILTGDQNLVDLSYIVRWNIKDLRGFKFSLVEPEETVKEVAEAAMRASVAEKTLDQTFSGEGRAEIELAVKKRMQDALDRYRAGIAVLGVEIDKADPPTEVVDAFKDVSVAEQNADAARNQARGYAQQQLSLARGEAEAFDKVYEQYRLAPEVTRQRLYYETMERVLSTTDKTVIEPSGVTSYLPLPEVRRRSQPAPIPTTTVTGRQ